MLSSQRQVYAIHTVGNCGTQAPEPKVSVSNMGEAHVPIGVDNMRNWEGKRVWVGNCRERMVIDHEQELRGPDRSSLGGGGGGGKPELRMEMKLAQELTRASRWASSRQTKFRCQETSSITCSTRFFNLPRGQQHHQLEPVLPLSQGRSDVLCWVLAVCSVSHANQS